MRFRRRGLLGRLARSPQAVCTSPRQAPLISLIALGPTRVNGPFGRLVGFGNNRRAGRVLEVIRLTVMMPARFRAMRAGFLFRDMRRCHVRV